VGISGLMVVDGGRYQNTHIVEVLGFPSNTLGKPFYGVRDEIGRLGRIGQLKTQCEAFPIAPFDDGILHVSPEACDCPNNGVTVCTYQLRMPLQMCCC
jgi:hypothetical protein